MKCNGSDVARAISKQISEAESHLEDLRDELAMCQDQEFRQLVRTKLHTMQAEIREVRDMCFGLKGRVAWHSAWVFALVLLNVVIVCGVFQVLGQIQ